MPLRAANRALLIEKVLIKKQCAERAPLLEQLEQDGQKSASQNKSFLDWTKYAEDRTASSFVIAVIMPVLGFRYVGQLFS